MLGLQDHRRTPRSHRALDPHGCTIGGQGLSRHITGLTAFYGILPPHLVILAASGWSCIQSYADLFRPGTSVLSDVCMYGWMSPIQQVRRRVPVASRSPSIGYVSSFYYERPLESISCASARHLGDFVQSKVPTAPPKSYGRTMGVH